MLAAYKESKAAYREVEAAHEKASVAHKKLRAAYGEAESAHGKMMAAYKRMPADGKQLSSAIDIYNTSSWPRTELITTFPWNGHVGIASADGQAVPSQRLSNGELAFLAKDIPPLAARRYFVRSAAPWRGGASRQGNASHVDPHRSR